MKKVLIPLLLMILLFGGAYYVVSRNNITPSKNSSTSNKKTTKDNNESSNKKKANAKLAKDFTLSDMEGNKVTLSELKGKKVFLNLWATWCGPCRKEMPDIEKLYQETKDTDLVILAVNLSENPNDVADFLKENNFNFTVLLDSEGEISKSYSVNLIPTSYFIDKDGYIIDSRSGTLTYEQMKSYIDKLD